MRISVPRSLSAIEASLFLRTLNTRAVRERDVEIDFSRLEFAMPFGTIALLVGLRQLLGDRERQGLKTSVTYDSHHAAGCGYLKHFGFFDHVHISAPPVTDSVDVNNDRFLLITKLSRESFEFNGVAMQEKLDQVCIQLSRVLFKNKSDDSPMVQATAWTLREAIRNVFEHAQVNDAFVTAQSWASGEAEIALGDCGIGIRDALSHAFEIDSGEHALTMAILPGITEYQGKETTNRWQNSGYGLYMLSEAAMEFGRLHLGSSGALLTAVNRRVVVSNSGFLRGTALGLRIKIDPEIYWNNFLERTKARGEEAAMHIKGARHKASASSSSSIWKQ